ncbi:hypothetical protein HDU98_002867 [Podochytrium sp. JEL0797]|nr:hypothetical protein HDU98_002867 [Podochytrium sp. JEL0797]
MATVSHILAESPSTAFSLTALRKDVAFVVGCLLSCTSECDYSSALRLVSFMPCAQQRHAAPFFSDFLFCGSKRVASAAAQCLSALSHKTNIDVSLAAAKRIFAFAPPNAQRAFAAALKQHRISLVAADTRPVQVAAKHNAATTAANTLLQDNRFASPLLDDPARVEDLDAELAEYAKLSNQAAFSSALMDTNNDSMIDLLGACETYRLARGSLDKHLHESDSPAAAEYIEQELMRYYRMRLRSQQE